MKLLSSELVKVLPYTQNLLFADLYQFTLLSGATDYFAALDLPVVWAGNTYRANGLRIEGLKLKLGTGLKVDSQDISIAAYPGETLAGTDFLSAVASGFLDGAYLTRSRAFWSPTTGIPTTDFAATPIGVITLCTMLVSEIGKIGRTHVEMTVKSPTKLLDADMPRNYYGIGCVHTLYDAGCTLSKAAFGIASSVDAGGNTLIVPWHGGIPHPISSDGLPTYQQGRLLFTGGVLNGSQFSIASNDAGNLFMMYPFSQIPGTDDTFIAYPGCSKMKNTCSLKFNNINNFRGFPFTPQVFVSL
jgi:hypothetical protein